MLEQHRVERVVVAPRQEGGEDVVDVVRLATACGVRVAVLPRLLEVIGTSVEFDDLGGQVLLGVRGFGLSPSSRVLKRAFDLVVATAACWSCSRHCCSPIAAAVKSTSRGPVLFRQTRIGRDGSDFKISSSARWSTAPTSASTSCCERNEAAALFKIADDPRMTRVGPLPAPHVARRAAAALQRAARRHEPRRPAPADPRGGPALLGLAAAALPRRARA